MSIVEPRTLACLPLQATQNAEFRHTPASHVVASFFPLDQCVAAVAALPALLLGLLDELRDLGVLGTVGRFVQLVVAERANFSPAARTLRILTALKGVNVRGFDPFTTFECWTVHPVLGVVFFVFAVP